MKKKKGIQIGKEAVKLSLFADDVILYNPKYSIKKVFKLINSVVMVYKINTQNSVMVPCTNNK